MVNLISGLLRFITWIGQLMIVWYIIKRVHFWLFMNNEQDLSLTICAVFLYDNTDLYIFDNWYIQSVDGKKGIS